MNAEWLALLVDRLTQRQNADPWLLLTETATAACYAVLDGELDDIDDEKVRELIEFVSLVETSDQKMSMMGWDNYLSAVVIRAEQAYDALAAAVDTSGDEDLPDV